MRYNEEVCNAWMLISIQCLMKLASMLSILWLAIVADALDGGYAFPFGLCIRRRQETNIPTLSIQVRRCFFLCYPAIPTVGFV